MAKAAAKTAMIPEASRQEPSGGRSSKSAISLCGPKHAR